MLLYYYARWHYLQAPKDVFGVWMNFLWFVLHFFSIPILLRTLISPFQRLSEQYEGGLDPARIAETIIVNILMRLVGFLIRSAIILLGIAFFLVVLSLGAIAMVLWFFVPIILPGLAALGVAFVFL